jgi:4-oxalocrotonate tautomerase
MPLVRIALPADRYPNPQAIGDCIHRAMVETIGVPPLDRFQVITRHPAGELVYDPSYLDIARGPGFLAIQITLNVGRTLAQKQALYARIAGLLADEAGVRKPDVLINLIETPRENWSFGEGIAQYA